jgi:hypothetical protein
MRRQVHAVRKPVRRPGAEGYLLITLITFGLSVSLTRLFLELTGYPQLGGGSSNLHIAHVLWGGLILLFAAILPLVLANRWVYQLGALLTGIGVGLFIDEVGKFITQNNDYFFPPAAPIIYTTFLIGVLFYLQFKRPATRGARSELYIALEMLEDLLDHDLDSREKEEIASRLEYVARQDDQPELSRFANSLLIFIQDENLPLVPLEPKFLQRLETRVLSLEERYLQRNQFRIILLSGLIVIGLFALISAIGSLMTSIILWGDMGILSLFFDRFELSNPTWFITLHLLQGFVGVALLYGSWLVWKEREREGLSMAYYALFVYLTAVDLMLFYYYQFSTIVSALIQFSLLLGLIYYRARYLRMKKFETI